MGPDTPGYPGSPPTRDVMARAICQVSSSVAAKVLVLLWLMVSKLPPRLIPPKEGLNANTPQKLAGRMVEPSPWVPSPPGTMPQATAAAVPLDAPPGVKNNQD